jgi:DNA-binding SARP family transcriptional activator
MRFNVLGPLEVTTDDAPIPIRAKRPRALLAVLLLHTTRIVPVERIIDGIWPEKPPRSAVENVRTYVCQLRSLLRDGDRPRLESHPGGYRLSADPDEVDLVQFTTLAGEGRQALHAGDYAEAGSLLGRALDLWNGNPLPDVDLGPAVRAKIQAVEEQRWSAEIDWIHARLALGEHAEMVSAARELLGERPLDESLWSCLVTALYAMGRTGEALAAYSEARRLFVDELGIEPGPQLKRVQAAVLAGEEPQAQPAAVIAVTARPARTAPHQLPPSSPELVGRSDELAKVHGVVEHARRDAGAHVPVVVVSGPPGVGKSATAVEAVNANRSAFPDGELYVDLRGSTGARLHPLDALISLIAGFEVSAEAIPAGLEPCRSLYRSLLDGRRTVIVLDDVSDADQVAPLLPGTSGSLVVVTSRRWLAEVEGDLHLRLEPLEPGEALRMLCGIVGPARIRDEPAAAESIVAACGMLPSAIRIAGTRLAARPQHPLRVLADRLSQGEGVLDELSLGRLSMRTLFDDSYHALDETGRQSFRYLSRLRFDEITANGLGDLLELPERLADRRLEQLVHEGLLTSGPADRGTPDYHMPAVLHQYACERFAMEDAQSHAMAGV